jgi:AAA domain
VRVVVVLCPERCGMTARVVRLQDVPPEAVSWLWRGYLPRGKVVVLDGDPGLGKSVLTLDIAARVSTGALMPDGSEPVKGGVLILSAEDGLGDTIRPRLDAAGADCFQVVTITEIDWADDEGDVHGRIVSIPADLDTIEDVITEHGVVLMILDVLMAYLGSNVNSHRDQDVRRALTPPAMMAERTGCCVLVLRHLNKSGGASAIYRGGGSIGIVGAARAGFMVGIDPADETGRRRVLAAVKCNLGPEPPALAYHLITDPEHGCARVCWDGISDTRASALLSDPGSDEDRSDRDQAAVWLTDYLTDNGGEAKGGDIIRAARREGIAERTLRRARDRAGVTFGRAGFGSGSVWRFGSIPAIPAALGPTENGGRDGRNGPESGQQTFPMDEEEEQ